MPHIGIDFDNTIIQYDEVIYKLAVEKRLIPAKLEQSKRAVRAYLNESGQDQQFTALQAEVYGSEIVKAKPAKGVLRAMKYLQTRGFTMSIVSHKTKYPIRGPKYNLRKAANQWIESNNINDILTSYNNLASIKYCETKEEKIKYISNGPFDIYIDDLSEILLALPPKITKIHYATIECKTNEIEITMDSWEDIATYIVENIS